jgi:hypothetical protein
VPVRRWLSQRVNMQSCKGPLVAQQVQTDSPLPFFTENVTSAVPCLMHLALMGQRESDTDKTRTSEPCMCGGGKTG